MSKYGLIVAADGKKITDAPAKIDSSRPHMIVDLERNPSHLQLIDPLPRSIPVNSTDGQVHKQTLGDPIKHGLGFTPQVMAYFQLLEFDGPSGGLNYNTGTSAYSGDYYNIGGTGTVSDFFTWEADKYEVRLIQTVQDAAMIGYNSLGQYYKFRVKLYICSVDTGTDFLDGLDVLR